MNRSLFAAAAALALFNPFAAVAQTGPAAGPLPDLDAQVRCAALFAMIAAEQNNKVPGSDRFPPMAKSGRDFFISTGLRLVEERKMSTDEMQPYFMAQINVIRADHAKTDNPAKAVDTEMAVCLKMAESVPPPPMVG